MTGRSGPVAVAKGSVDQVVAKQIVQMTLDAIIAALATEGRLELRDFGVFEVQIRKARKGRNPKTGVEVMVPDRKRVRFKMGKIMEEQINNGAAPAGQIERGTS